MKSENETEKSTDLGRKRTTMDKIRLYRARFSGRVDIYGTYDPNTGRSWQLKQCVTDHVILNHLKGIQPYGVYLLEQSTTPAVVADFDNEDFDPIMSTLKCGDGYDLPLHLERSKSKGFHIWMFFSRRTSARKARLVMHHILEEAECGRVEVFPKQDRIEGTECGNFINAPLFGPLVNKGRTVFLDRADDFRPFANQWCFLEGVPCVDESELDEVISVNELGAPPIGPNGRILGRFEGPSGLPPCTRRMLEEGVTRNQRVSCFRIAVNLRRIGLDFDAAVVLLEHWAKRNRPLDEVRIITSTEIKAQTASAYLKEYHGYGCEDPAVAPFCEPTCPIFSARRPQF